MSDKEDKRDLGRRGEKYYSDTVRNRGTGNARDVNLEESKDRIETGERARLVPIPPKKDKNR